MGRSPGAPLPPDTARDRAAETAARVASLSSLQPKRRATAADLATDIRRLTQENGAVTSGDLARLGWSAQAVKQLGDAARDLLRKRFPALAAAHGV